MFWSSLFDRCWSSHYDWQFGRVRQIDREVCPFRSRAFDPIACGRYRLDRVGVPTARGQAQMVVALADRPYCVDGGIPSRRAAYRRGVDSLGLFEQGVWLVRTRGLFRCRSLGGQSLALVRGAGVGDVYWSRLVGQRLWYGWAFGFVFFPDLPEAERFFQSQGLADNSNAFAIPIATIMAIQLPLMKVRVIYRP